MLQAQPSLHDKLRGAVQSLLSGRLSEEQFLEALECEASAVETTQNCAPAGDLGDAMVEALGLYLDCLVQVEELMLAGEQLDHEFLQPIYQQAGEANTWLDELSAAEPETNSDIGFKI